MCNVKKPHKNPHREQQRCPLQLLKSTLKLMCVRVGLSMKITSGTHTQCVSMHCYFWIAFEMLDVSSDFRFRF